MVEAGRFGSPGPSLSFVGLQRSPPPFPFPWQPHPGALIAPRTEDAVGSLLSITICVSEGLLRCPRPHLGRF